MLPAERSGHALEAGGEQVAVRPERHGRKVAAPPKRSTGPERILSPMIEKDHNGALIARPSVALITKLAELAASVQLDEHHKLGTEWSLTATALSSGRYAGTVQAMLWVRGSGPYENQHEVYEWLLDKFGEVISEHHSPSGGWRRAVEPQ